MSDGQRGNKLLGLEILRFIAALSVLIYHYQHFSFVGYRPPSKFDDFPFYKVLEVLYVAGLRGVWVFWCISGFIFFWKYRQPVFDHSIGGFRFFVLRFSRLYPLHVFTLLVVAVLQAAYSHRSGSFFVYQHNDLWHFFLQIFLASNWGFEQGDSFNGPVWSISVEVLVYVCFFLALRLVSRSICINVIVIVGCIGAKLIHNYQPILDCFVFFYLGGIAAMARKSLDGMSIRVTVYPVAWCLAGAMPAGVFVFELYRMEHFAFPFFFVYTPILLFCFSGDRTIDRTCQQIIETAGNMTYASYLLHFPIQLMIALYFLIVGAPIPYHSGEFFSFFIVTTLAASYLSYRYFELPAQSRIRETMER